ncbi:Forkhead box protein D2 [Marasmius tenuissimus]|uniref:Forkhead box protein D2 n=1 Tax=Marasmius tenuissimus TaxID=585030 RepID=A0ABR3A342_9AGAR
MNDRFCNGDVEFRVRTGSQNGTELVELEVVSQEVPNRSQFSGRHSSGIGELETLDNGSIHSSRYSPNNDAVALAHSKHEQESLEDEIGSIECGTPSTILETVLIDIHSSIGTVSQGAIEDSTQAPEDRTRESTPTTRIPPHDEPKAQPNSTTLALDLDNNSSLHHRNVPLGPSDVAGVENQLRRLYNISPAVPVDLYAIPDPLCPPFTQIAIIQIAIWSSEQRKLTQAQIWSRIEQRFRIESVEEAQKWKTNIRHLLSLKKTFVKLPESRSGTLYWVLDYRYLEPGGGDKYVRKRRAEQQHHGDDHDHDTKKLQDDPNNTEDSPDSSFSPSRKAE